VSDAPSPFDDAVVAAVVQHMNADHSGDSLLICRTLGRQPSARDARMVGFTPEHAVFSARIDGGDVEVRVPWSGAVRERSDVRAEIVGMYEAACAEAGIAARPH
jgi:hypothetical protein